MLEEMGDEELIELYEHLKEISNISWMVRCCVLGVSKERAVRGDGTIRYLAKEFGIGVRAAQMDIRVYEAFIRGNPDFEAVLPADFYRIALKCPDPKQAIEYAAQKRIEAGHYPAAIFAKEVSGEVIYAKADTGTYRIEKIDGIGIEDGENIERLYGRCEIFSLNGVNYVQIK